MVPRIWNIWKRIVGEKFVSFAKLRPFGVQEVLELHLTLFEFVIARFILSLFHNIRVLDVHYKVNLEVEFKLLVCKIFLTEIHGNEIMECIEELNLVAAIKVGLNCH